MSETMFKAKCERMERDCSPSKYGFRLSGAECLVPGMRCPVEETCTEYFDNGKSE